jgi:hypothetical protein
VFARVRAGVCNGEGVGGGGCATSKKNWIKDGLYVKLNKIYPKFPSGYKGQQPVSMYFQRPVLSLITASLSVLQVLLYFTVTF